ncbi:MAG TPA: type II and III secretion system protein [Bryobacteraceae bacterium]|jgi:general secretion pathway protein D|nr:type II and III secretion system protein [Bryobacteraceae bacterium]
MRKTSITVVLLLAAGVRLYAGSDPVAARLAKEARKAQDTGQVVRAYLLFTEAAARDPHSVSYAVQRDAMKPLADLMTKANIVSPKVSSDVADEIKKAEGESSTPNDDQAQTERSSSGLPEISREDLRQAETLQPPPQLQVPAETHDIDLRGDSKIIATQVARLWGIDIVFDPDLQPKPNLHFVLTGADFRVAMDALTAATDTFLFAIAPHRIFVATDTEIKRSEFEPEIALAIPVPEAMDPKQVVEAANAIRQTVGIRSGIAWDSAANRIIIRDHVIRARTAYSLLQAVLLPRGQASFEVQIMELDNDTQYQYGISWQTAYQFLPLGLAAAFPQVANIQGVIPGSIFLPFGGGLTLFGVGLTEATLLANYSSSKTRVLFDSTVVVADGQTATLHVGDQYPVATTLYSGASLTTGPAAYNPIGQVTQVDLGLKLKMGPHIHGNGSVGLDLEASYQTLGTVVLNTVPSINTREIKGSVMLEEGQWAVIGGMESDTRSETRSGFPGLSSIPVLQTIFTQTTREHRKAQVLVVIKPTITRLPMTAEISPQFLLGPQHGPRVLL